MSIDVSTLVTRIDDVMCTMLDQELVILNLATNNYVALDAVGRRIWELLASPCRVGDLCERLCREYEGDPSQITTDVQDYLTELLTEKLIISS